MKSKAVIRRTRAVILIACILLCGLTLMRLHAISDPLTRYPYGTPEERDRLTLLLNDEEINTLINMQLQPEQVLPFADAEEFTMKNILFYDLAMETQKADPQFIVYFVNQYRDRLDLQSMETVLGWMSYTDLIDYFESASSKPLLGQSPLDLTTVMDGNATLGRWRPADLKEISSGIYLRFDAAQAWDKMSAAASADGISLVPENGYMSVEQQQSMKDYASYPQGPYGTREEQLGLTVHLQGFDGWNETLSSQKFDEDYTPAMEELSDEQKNEIEWLNRNAWKYGWIIRYPQGKEKITGMNYQPFVLRYVGVPAARSLQEQKKALEEYKK